MIANRSRLTCAAAIAAALFFAPAAAHAQLNPWTKLGATVSISVSNTTAHAALVTTSPTVWVCNTGTVLAYVGFGDTTYSATTADTPIPGGLCGNLSPNGATFMAAITASSTTTIIGTPGAGALLAAGGGGGGGGGAATIANGADVALGSTTDTACATPTGTCTLIALTKYLNSIGIPITSLPALAAGTAVIGKVGIDQTTPGTTNAVQPTTSGDIIINPSNSFVRPGNTTPYASGQLVANSVTAGSVVPLTWTASRIATGNFRVSRARMTLSGKSVTNTNFRLHLFNATTTVSNGDGATFVPTLAANEVCEMDITIALAGADVSTGYGAANQGTACDVSLASGSALFGLIEARAAYTPVSAETVLVVLEIHQN